MKFFKKYPLIYFPSDISFHLHETTEKALKAGKKLYEIKAERYCFENADGIMHKGAPNELNLLNKENMLGSPLKITSKIICFNPYCSDEFIVPINKNKLSKGDKHLHFVYIGSFYNGPKDIDLNLNFIRRLTDQKIHVHLYAKTHHLSKEDDQRQLDPLIKFFQNNKYFHIEFAFPPKELSQEISKYDFGFWIDIVRGEGDLEHVFSTGNKMASYFEAGIPFVVVESDPSNLNQAEQRGYLFVEGSGTEDSALLSAGIEKAEGIVVCINDDGATLLVTLAARELASDDIHIIAQGSDPRIESRLKRAGANQVPCLPRVWIPSTSCGYIQTQAAITVIR